MQEKKIRLKTIKNRKENCQAKQYLFTNLSLYFYQNRYASMICTLIILLLTFFTSEPLTLTFNDWVNRFFFLSQGQTETETSLVWY